MIYHKAFSALDERESALQYGQPSSDEQPSDDIKQTDPEESTQEEAQTEETKEDPGSNFIPRNPKQVLECINYKKPVKIYRGTLSDKPTASNVICLCSVCKTHAMILRSKGGKLFIACSGFPSCRNITTMPEMIKKITPS